MAFICLDATGQSTLSEIELSDFSERVMKQAYTFMNSVQELAEGQLSEDEKELHINITESVFIKNGKVQERNKNSDYTKTWKVRNYLKSIRNRGQTTPILISFKVLDNPAPAQMTIRFNDDGSTTYKGRMRFRQSYCKLKSPKEWTEMIGDISSANCSYFDTTNKRVKFEITLTKIPSGTFWITKLSSVEVEDVFDEYDP